MINREIIRNKVVQLTYAYYQNGNKNIDSAEKELLFSLSKAYDLYAYMLALIPAVAKESRKYLEVAQSKAQREGTDMPSQKFAYNRFAIQVEQNTALNDILEAKKISWNDHPEFVNKLYLQIIESQIYKEYMDSQDDSYDADREVWRKLYRTLIENNESIDSILEEESLYWNDDKEIVDTFVLKTIKRFEEANGAEQQLLPEFKDDEDKEFARRLFRRTILNAEYYRHLISENTRNWDLERVALMDIIIMQIALAEILSFPNIPVSVTFNEYLEIAKLYSTPKSASFVNGTLDAIVNALMDEDKLFKNELPINIK